MHSDRLESKESGDIIELWGNVKLKHGATEIQSGNVFWLRARGIARFFENVALTDTSFRVYCDTLFYTRSTKIGEAFGNVILVNPDSTLIVSGKRGIYRGREDFVAMTDSPSLWWLDSAGNEITMSSRMLSHSISDKMSFGVSNVAVKIVPPDSTAVPTEIFCDSLVFRHDKNELLAFGWVKVIQGQLSIEAPEGIFLRGENKALFWSGVNITGAEFKLVADTVEIIFSDAGPKSVLAKNSPKGLWRDTINTELPESRFSAKEMLFEFEDKKLSIAHLIRQARIEYHTLSENKKHQIHNLSGDSAVAFFKESKVDSVETFGCVEGLSIELKENPDTIRYKSSLLALSLGGKRVYLSGNAWAFYHDMVLSAGNIEYNADTRILHARYTLKSDSIIGNPVLREKNDSLRAQEMMYNVDTKRGKLFYGNTQVDQGFFNGEVAAKTTGDTFYVEKATFTTCENDPPHYHFYSPQLKLIPKDKAIARPVIMYIDKLPVFWLPFMVFSLHTQRHSGILSFTIGKFQKGEHFIRDLGYYWAISDYFDFLTAMDIDEKTGIYVKGEANYALRYYFTGNVFASYKISGERNWDIGTQQQQRWELRQTHNQTIGKVRLVSGVTLVSDAQYLEETSENPQERMNKNLRSFSAVSRAYSWGNLSLSWERTQNLVNRTISTYLPRLSISVYSMPFFQKKGTVTSPMISGNILAVGYRFSDTMSIVQRYGSTIDGKLNWNYKVGDYFSIAPTLSAKGTIIDRGVDSTKFPALIGWNFATSFATDLYGNLPVGFLNIKFFHHIISPRIGFSYSPQIKGGENFYSFGGISAPGSEKSASMTFSLTQQFGIKTVDTSGNTVRVPLFDVSSSGSYNFLAERRALSYIYTVASARPLGWLSLTAGFLHSPYSSSSQSKPSGLYLLSENIQSSARFQFILPFPDAPKQGSLDISHYISINNETNTRTHWAKLGISAFATPNWKVNYSIYYDIENDSKVSEDISIWRDLHCWEMSFIWIPSGIRAGYYIKANIKKLPDIKVERTEGNVRWIR